MPKKYTRRPLPLHPRGSFRFTAKTVSIDVSSVVEGDDPTKILHVGRTLGALEFPGSSRPAQRLDLAIVMSILEAVDEHRVRNFEPPVSTLFDPRFWDDVKRLAATILPVASPKVAGLPEGSSIPFPGRPTRCFESHGIHPGENLWITTDTGDAVLERVTRTLTEAGRAYTVERRFEITDTKSALLWLEEEGATFIPSVLVDRLTGRKRPPEKGLTLELRKTGGATDERVDKPPRPRPARAKKPRSGSRPDAG